MRQRLHLGGVNGEIGIEEIGETNAVGFGDQPQQVTVAVERPGPALPDDFQSRFLVAINEAMTDLASGILKGDFNDLIAEPLQIDDLGGPAGRQALEVGAGLDLFQCGHEEFLKRG